MDSGGKLKLGPLPSQQLPKAFPVLTRPRSDSQAAKHNQWHAKNSAHSPCVVEAHVALTMNF